MSADGITRELKPMLPPLAAAAEAAAAVATTTTSTLGSKALPQEAGVVGMSVPGGDGVKKVKKSSAAKNYHVPRLDMRLKLAVVDKILGPRNVYSKYLDVLEQYLNALLSRKELHEEILRLFGREHIQLHNEIMYALLYNANASEPPCPINHSRLHISGIGFGNDGGLYSAPGATKNRRSISKVHPQKRSSVFGLAAFANNKRIRIETNNLMGPPQPPVAVRLLPLESNFVPAHSPLHGIPLDSQTDHACSIANIHPSRLIERRRIEEMRRSGLPSSDRVQRLVQRLAQSMGINSVTEGAVLTLMHGLDVFLKSLIDASRCRLSHSAFDGDFPLSYKPNSGGITMKHLLSAIDAQPALAGANYPVIRDKICTKLC